jgi:mannose-6-phosphate isomerase
VPSAGPEAELWFGAYSGDPSTVDGDGSLAELIEADPAGTLGVAARHGARLPFLLKVLAADHPLSIQAHPDAEQARMGYQAERALGLSAAERTYADPYHKPELLVAVTEFSALCGFQDPATSATQLAGLGCPELDGVVDALRSGELRRAVEALFALAPGVVTQAVSRAGSGDPDSLAARLGAEHPHDVGVLVALLLRQVRLRPDEAVFLPAGNLHCYLRGVGVEIMAASDNVLRGGLTPKSMNVPELLRTLRYEVTADPVVGPVPVGPGVVTWPLPLPDFTLTKATVTGQVGIPGGGPRIAMCLRGPVELRVGADRLTLRGGEAAFVAADESEVECASSSAVLFQAGTAL